MSIRMNRNNTELLIIGVILGAVVLTFGFLIYLCTKKKSKDAGNTARRESEIKFLGDADDDFVIPMKYYTLKGQVPPTSPQREVLNRKMSLNKEDYPQLNCPHSAPRVRKTSSHGSYKSSQDSAPGFSDSDFENHNDIIWESGDESKNKSKQRRKHKGLKRYKSNMSLTQKTISEDMMSELEVRKQSASSGEENQIRRISVYDSTLIDVGQQTLARNRGEIVTPKKSFKKVGMIHFSTQYFDETGEFEIHVVRASALATKHEQAKVNTFVRLYLMPGKRQRQDTKLAVKNKNPFYDELIVFKDIQREELENYKLKLKVYNRDRLMKNELLGQVDILLSSVNLQRREMFDIFLFKQRSPISHTSACITLCHLATFSKLEVFVDTLQKIPRKKKNSTMYGSVTLFKENMSVRKLTAVKFQNKDATFRESFLFDVVTNSSIPLTTFSLVFSLIERNIFGQDEVMGHVIFSMNSPQNTAMKQWLDVQSQPHQKHTSWHSLVDPDEL